MIISRVRYFRTRFENSGASTFETSGGKMWQGAHGSLRRNDH